MPAIFDLSPTNEANESHRLALNQAVQRTADQAQTIVELTAAQTLQRMSAEAQRVDLMTTAGEQSIGVDAARTLQGVMNSPGFLP